MTDKTFSEPISDLIKDKTTKILDSKDIFGVRKLVLIKHHQELYRLTITKQGKLILTK